MFGDRRKRGLGTLAASAALVFGSAGVAPAAAGSGRLVSPRSASFVSLWPRDRGRTIGVEQFSLRSGRLLSTLAVEPGSPAEVGPPHPDASGHLFITTDDGPSCGSNVEGCAPISNSCQSTVTRLNPVSGKSQRFETFPSSELVSDAIPSPRGDLLVVATGGCTTAYFDEHFVVEDLNGLRSWPIGADARVCHSLSSPAWNASGTELAFAYGPSAVTRAGQWGSSRGESCLAPRASGVVIVSATHASNPGSWRFIAPRRGCSYTSAAFDDLGIAAFEACAPGLRGGASNDFLGPDFLVQLNPRGRIVFRDALELGANPGAVLSDPVTGKVLVTQDQTYREHQPTHNWVWQLQGRHLRVVASYPFDGFGVVAAQPW